MPDYNPLLLRRMLMLRQLPIFAGPDLDELATIAENLVETKFRAGATIVAAHAPVDHLHVVVDGRIESTSGQSWGPRQIFGALEALADRPLSSAAIAVEDTNTLRLSAQDFNELLEDNFGVLLSTLHALAGRMIDIAPITRSAWSGEVGDCALGLVERLILLRQQLPFAGARLQALALLANASDEVTWPAGTVVTRAGEPASSALVIISGTMRARRGDATHVLEPGASIGYLEALAGVHHTTTTETISPVRALRSPAPALLDVLEDHTEVGVSILATFAATLLDGASHLN